MEYNELITQMQHTPIDVPDTDTILGDMRRTMHHRRQQKTILATVTCLLLASVPLTFLSSKGVPSPTQAEIVSASLPSASDNLPAPLAGFKNSIRNHQTTTII